MCVPAGITLRVLCRDPGCCAVRSTEHDGTAELAAGHVERLGCRVDDMVDRLHGKIEGHEFDDRLQTSEGRTHAKACETDFSDRRIDHSLCTELFKQTLTYFVGALIFGDLFAHQEDVGI